VGTLEADKHQLLFLLQDDERPHDYVIVTSSAGVKNIEMESPEFAAFTYHLHIPAVLMCVTLLDRTKGDEVSGGSHIDSYIPCLRLMNV